MHEYTLGAYAVPRDVLTEPLRTPALSRHRLPLVGLVRVELTTSRLSGVRSNHLSYRPKYWIVTALDPLDSGKAAIQKREESLRESEL